MKTRKLFLTVPVLAVVLSMGACGEGGGGNDPVPTHDWTDVETVEMSEDFAGSGNIKVWVGKESVEFYQAEAAKWIAAHQSNPEFKFTVTVEAHDSGSVAGDLENDATVCADIFTAAHDNVGKLAQEKLAKPFYSKNLVDQIENDNSAEFFEVAHSVVDKQRAVYGAPYIAQSLFLMYDKRYVTETQAQTFEGLSEAAAARNSRTKAIVVTGQDGFNYSFPLLAQNNETHATTMKIYKDGDKKDCWAQGEDSVANLQWARRYYANPNGLTWPSSSGWQTDVNEGGAIALISGSWNYNSFASAIGETNVGVGMIPTFTLTEEDVAGTTQTAGTVMRGGTFGDCKVFMINAKSEGPKYVAEQSLIKYLSTKEVQQGSLKSCDNLPSYKGASQYVETIKDELGVSKYKLAKAQINMAAYSIPQPFTDGTLNSYFYSKGAPNLYAMVTENTDGKYGTTQAAREILYRMQHIWEKGKDPEKTIPATLPAEI